MKKIIKKFKEKIYLKIFEGFKSKNKPGAEMLAALTINALRELNHEQRYRLALDMAVRLYPEHQKILVREILKSAVGEKHAESLHDKLLLRQLLFKHIGDKAIANKLDEVIKSLSGIPTHTI